MPVEAGQEAPDFTLRDQNGSEVTLSAFRGEKNVVLVFYPFAFSGTCTSELCSVRDRLPEFDNDDTVTLAVSCDTVFTQKVFAEKEGYTFGAAVRLLAARRDRAEVRRLPRGARHRSARDVHHRQAGHRAVERRPRLGRGPRRRRVREGARLALTPVRTAVPTARVAAVGSARRGARSSAAGTLGGSGRIAQLVRAPALQAGGQGFESLCAHTIVSSWCRLESAPRSCPSNGPAVGVVCGR